MLTTQTLVKSHLNLTGTTFDTVITTIVNAIDAYIERKTGVVVGAETVSVIANEIAHSRDTLTIWTLKKPIVSITNIEYKDANGDWNTYADETIADVDFDGNEIYPRHRVVSEGRRNIRLNYTAGYVADTAGNGTPDRDVPTDLELACTLIAAGIFNQRNQVGVKSQTTLGFSQTIEDFIAKDAMISELLTPYLSQVYAL